MEVSTYQNWNFIADAVIMALHNRSAMSAIFDISQP